jgi:hypothetical protein
MLPTVAEIVKRKIEIPLSSSAFLSICITVAAIVAYGVLQKRLILFVSMDPDFLILFWPGKWYNYRQIEELSL